MPKIMVGTAHRANLSAHSGVHDWNGFCDIEPKCVEHRELPDPEEAKEALKARLREPTFAVYDDPPSHYDGGAIQPWDVIDAFGLDYYLGNVLKYTCRAGKKDGETRLKDLKKIRNFINRAIEMEERNS